MTVGVSALAELAEIVILGTDMRATFPRLGSPHDECGKAWDLPEPFRCGVATAGLLSIAQPFVDQLAVNVVKLAKQEPIYPEHVENEIDDARFRIYRRRADWLMKTSYGVTLSQWQRGKVPAGKLDPLTLKAGELLLQNMEFPLESIVAGFIRSSLLFYKASGKRHLEQSATPGVFVIGTGGSWAMQHLNRRSQSMSCSLARSLLHVAEALDEAKKEPHKTVGKPSRLLVIAKDGSMGQIEPDHPTLLGWKRAYAGRDSTWSLQNNKAADIQAKAMIRPYHKRD